MKIVQTVEMTIKTEEITDVLCNKCGKSCNPAPGTKHGFYGLVEATVYGGYASPALEDLTKYTFSICEHCIIDMFASFMHPPLKEETSALGEWED